jgi:hypothetical protein
MTPDEARKLADNLARLKHGIPGEPIDWEGIERALRSLADQVETLQQNLAANEVLFDTKSQLNAVDAAIKDREYREKELAEARAELILEQGKTALAAMQIGALKGIVETERALRDALQAKLAEKTALYAAAVAAHAEMHFDSCEGCGATTEDLKEELVERIVAKLAKAAEDR